MPKSILHTMKILHYFYIKYVSFIQFIERGGKFFIKVYDTKCCYVTVNGDGPQPPPNNNVVNIEFKGKKIDETHAKQIRDIISKELKLKKDQEQ